MVEYQPADNSQPEDNEAGEGFGAQVLWEEIEGAVGVLPGGKDCNILPFTFFTIWAMLLQTKSLVRDIMDF